MAENQKPIDLYYVTDPICSFCWALEPVYRRFKLEYGHYFNEQSVMGGLLEKWHGGPIDPANGINGPQDVAGHWREVGEHYRMPIDGSLWFDNPVQSSFPPSRVFKIIQKQHGDEKANEYLRRTREELFAFNQNIADPHVMIEIVNRLGLSGEVIVKEAEEKEGQQLLFNDFGLARSLGATGFPTIVMINQENQGLRIVGNRPYIYYEETLKQVLNVEKLERKSIPDLSTVLESEKLLFTREIEELYGLEQSEVEGFIKNELAPESYEIKEVLGEKYLVTK